MEQILTELQELAQFSDAPAPAVTRVLFTEKDMQARAWFKARCEEAGLQVRIDAVGNTFARWIATSDGEAAVGTGSHIDAIPNAGMYDGTVGVLGGLQAIRDLQKSGFRPRRSIELLLFTAEEPTRYGIGCLGSRLLSGALDPERADNIADKDGHLLHVTRKAANCFGPLQSVKLSPGYYSSFVELHIEQGPLLEREQISIGIVTAIAAPASIRVMLEGEGGHAGAVLMPDRRDAFLAAAELALAVEHAALSTGSVDTVATTGVCEVFPGAVNSVPSRVRLEIDIRDIDGARRDAVIGQVAARAESIAATRNVSIRSEIINADAPAKCDGQMVEVVAQVCNAKGVSFRRMVSRAYHDSLFMSRIAPVTMIFIPCRSGVSHRPDEYASPEAILTGVEVLAGTLAQLAV